MSDIPSSLRDLVEIEAPVIKPTGAIQREDIKLSLAIASALRERIFSGESVYPAKGESFALQIGEGEEKSIVNVSHWNVLDWVKRGNVIPENGKTLRAYLDEARLEYRTEKEAERRAEIREIAETRLLEITSIPLKTGADVLKTYRKKDGAMVLTGEEHQSYGAGANPKTLETVLKGVMFGLERLAPEQYSPKSSVTSTNLHIFSLADLRKAKDERDQAREAIPA